jgi:hypothetical protein
MRSTCAHEDYMGVMTQIRHVPESLHQRLKARAAVAGMSLSDYLLAEPRQAAELPTLAEICARLETRSATTLSQTPAEAVRAERDGH